MLVCEQDCFSMRTVLSDRELGACSTYSRAKSGLTTFFKFNSFRPGQLEVFFANPSPSGCVCQDGNWCWKVLVF